MRWLRGAVEEGYAGAIEGRGVVVESVDIEKLIAEEVPPDAPEWVKRILRLNQAILERHMEDTGKMEGFLTKQVKEVEDLVKIMENFVGPANKALAEYDDRLKKLEVEVFRQLARKGG